jgi:hypothetical protein
LVFVRRLVVGVLVGLALANIACGSLANDSTRRVQVNVNPVGARIFVDGIYAARAPGTLHLSQSVPHSVEVQAEGYTSRVLRVEPKTNGGYVVLDCILLLFLIVPGVIALVVDGATGDWKVIDTDRLTVVLDPAQQPQAAATAPNADPGARTGCQYDTQCKGDRICRAGQCVDPAPP